MSPSTLRQKFTAGFIGLVIASVVLMLGVRWLGKSARFHYVERNRLALITEIDHSISKVLDALNAARAICGSLPIELFSVEIFALRAVGLGPVLDSPGNHLIVLKTAQTSSGATFRAVPVRARTGCPVRPAGGPFQDGDPHRPHQ